MKKISKARAMRIYNAGGTVILAASKMIPECGAEVDLVNSAHAAFAHIINEYYYYNCCTELGKRVCFYTND